MARRSLPLGPVTVTFPCSASWDAMPGDDRVRFCMECSLQVYNLSALEPEAARALIQQREGKLCVRFYRRDDGTILTQDCPVGLRAFTRRAEQVRLVFTALAASVVTDPPLPAPAGSPVADAVAAVAAAAAAAGRVPGVGTVARWQLAAAVTCGLLLAPSWPARVANTSWLWAAPR